MGYFDDLGGFDRSGRGAGSGGGRRVARRVFAGSGDPGPQWGPNGLTNPGPNGYLGSRAANRAARLQAGPPVAAPSMAVVRPPDPARTPLPPGGPGGSNMVGPGARNYGGGRDINNGDPWMRASRRPEVTSSWRGFPAWRAGNNPLGVQAYVEGRPGAMNPEAFRNDMFRRGR